jgi:protein phosphatase
MQELVERGFYTPEQAEQSLNKNLVTRAVGIEETVQVDVFDGVAHPGDIYLLCSDGLTDMVKDDIIRNTIMNNREDLKEIATELIRVSNESGGKDNISAILARPLEPFASNMNNSLYSRFFELFS